MPENKFNVWLMSVAWFCWVSSCWVRDRLFQPEEIWCAVEQKGHCARATVTTLTYANRAAVGLFLFWLRIHFPGVEILTPEWDRHLLIREWLWKDLGTFSSCGKPAFVDWALQLFDAKFLLLSFCCLSMWGTQRARVSQLGLASRAGQSLNPEGMHSKVFYVLCQSL